MQYELNEPDAAAEVFDDEVLVIHLGKGDYHSLRGGAGTTRLVPSGAAKALRALGRSKLMQRPSAATGGIGKIWPRRCDGCPVTGWNWAVIPGISYRWYAD